MPNSDTAIFLIFETDRVIFSRLQPLFDKIGANGYYTILGMSLIFLFFLILTVLIFLVFKKYRRAFIASSLCTSLFLMIGSGFIPGLFLKGLQTHPPLDRPQWKKNNVIVLLGSGAVKWSDQSPDTNHISLTSSAYARVHEAVRLYYHCKLRSNPCRILPTGGDPGQNSITEAEIMRQELKAIGVNESDILAESESNNTFQNAQFSSQLIRRDHFDYIVLVTSGTHMKRALMLFSYFDIKAISAPADHLSTSTSWKQLYQNFFVTDLALHEYVGYLKFLLLLSK